LASLLSAVSGNSVMTPAGVIRPILLPPNSVNHRLPSCPAVMPAGKLLGVTTGNNVIDCAATWPVAKVGNARRIASPQNDDVRWHKLMIFHIQFIRGGAKASGMAMAMANNAAARFQFRHHMPFNPNLLHGLPQPLRPSKKI